MFNNGVNEKFSKAFLMIEKGRFVGVIPSYEKSKNYRGSSIDIRSWTKRYEEFRKNCESK